MQVLSEIVAKSSRLLRSFDQICSFLCNSIERALQMGTDLQREDRRIYNSKVCSVVNQQMCINHTCRYSNNISIRHIRKMLK